MPRAVSTTRPPGVGSMPAAAVMSHPVVAVHAAAPLAEALSALHVAGVRHLAVVDDVGRCVGVLCDRSVAAAWARDPIHFARWSVSSVTAPDPSVVPQSASVADVARAMRRHETDVVVVVDGDLAPIGLITAGDLVALLAKPSPAGDRERVKRLPVVDDITPPNDTSSARPVKDSPR